MIPAMTEAATDAYRGLDLWPDDRILSAIATAQGAAIVAVQRAVPALAAAGAALAARLKAGGRMIYAGAGSSGLIAQLDALELPGTYGIAADRVPVLLAGGDAALRTIPSGAEDDTVAAIAGVAGLGIGPRDAVVAIAASGRTPFTVACLEAAKDCGAFTVGIACNADTPLLTSADIAVLLATPAEVVAGSTRMNAGTAQKCALNMLSTLIGVRLGGVYDGHMVNVETGNAKLKRRAIGIVATACDVDEAAAASLVERTGADIKAAIVLARLGDGDVAEAKALLAAHDDNLRAALAALAA
jgi:N-acetylmuramic acid 6-phosphate etherase